MEIMEQHLCDQAKMIKKREWITKLELENIRRNDEDIHEDEENIHEKEATQVDTENLGAEEIKV